jgi:hypothetical protein
MKIHPDRLALDVPHDVEQLIRLYGECRYERPNLVFSIPAYRYREEIEPALWRAAHDCVKQHMPKTYEHICEFVKQGQSCAEIMGRARATPNLNQKERLLSQIEGAVNHLIRTRNLLTEGRK